MIIENDDGVLAAKGNELEENILGYFSENEVKNNSAILTITVRIIKFQNF